MDVRRERIPLLWSTVGETELTEGFCSTVMGEIQFTKYYFDYTDSVVCF